MHVDFDTRRPEAQAVAGAAWHSLFWLVFANSVGVLLAVLLLVPALNKPLGEWTYGRWMMVHMNLELYGWTSLPMVGFLFRIYGADRGPAAKWCRPVLWIWSVALAVGALSWLSGHSSGKLFLDWSGYARVLFPAALITLWLLLAVALVTHWRQPEESSASVRIARLTGLVILLAVPFVLFIASNPNLYPPVNPATGGPTGESQLESSLAIVFILLMLPFGIARRKSGHSRIITASWIVLVAESLLCISMGRASVSNHLPSQYLSLGSVLVWIPLTPAYYRAFGWNQNTRRWRLAFLGWWAALLVTGWIFFLPPVLDHFKFTDGLVGHSFVAMAGFTSSLIIFVMVQMLGKGAWIFNRGRAFWLWHGSVVVYVLLMTVAGWREGSDPAFTIVPGPQRNIIYVLRLLSGMAMLIASADWLADATKLLRRPLPLVSEILEEKTA
jgi:cytochrome c oxidase cbb3-type subunit I